MREKVLALESVLGVNVGGGGWVLLGSLSLVGRLRR